jgi:ribosome-binding ATPase YchF (GTP1/OBG family)
MWRNQIWQQFPKATPRTPPRDMSIWFRITRTTISPLKRLWSARISRASWLILANRRPSNICGLGVEDSGVHALIRAVYHLLGLRTFFTTGEKETRAWTIHAGDKAPAAAGAIHSDFERGFIAAETIYYNDLVAAGSFAKAREAGKLRLEGKDYEVRDGDVILFRFNV